MPTYDPTTCYNNLLGANLHPCPDGAGGSGSLSFHCQSVSQDLHSWCYGQDVYYPLKWQEAYNTTLCAADVYHDGPGDNPNICSPQVFGSINDQTNWILNQPNPKIWMSRECDCCCSCFAYGTPVAVSSEAMKSIEKFELEDDVLTAALAMPTTRSGKMQITWSQSKVKMSMGSPPLPAGQKNYPDVIHVNYGAGLELICTLDQVFLLANGKLKHASQLALTDKLTAPDGSPVEINSVKVAQYAGGIHHIATSVEPVKNANGHLLNTNGVITGDYSLQISTGKMGDSLETSPHIGSDEYDKLHASSARSIFHYSKDVDNVSDGPQTLHLYVKNTQVPDSAMSFIDPDQSMEIDANAKFRNPFDPITASLTSKLFKIFNAFYPDIQFYIDKTDMSANAYAFMAYGQKHVVITGKMLRVDTLYWEGVSLILAQCVASFDPQTSQLLLRSEADLLSTKYVFRTVFPFTQNSVYQAAMTQITTLFDYVKKNNGGDPKQPKRFPALACRLETYNSGEYGGDLPQCAGGQPVPLSFMVYWAKYDSAKKVLTIAFSLSLDPKSIGNMKNYTLDPLVLPTGATTSVDKQINLNVDLSPATNYQITILGVKSIDGQDISASGNNYVSFTTDK